MTPLRGSNHSLMNDYSMSIIPFQSEFLPYNSAQAGFEPGALSERLLEFDARSNPLGHHGSLMQYYFTIKYRFKKCSFQTKAFAREGKSYTWLIPSLQKFRAEKKLKPLSFPKCFYASVNDSLIILENMKAKGFEVVEKKIERKLQKKYNDV